MICFSIFGGWIDGEREKLMDREDEDQFLEDLHDNDRYTYNPESAVHIHMYDLFHIMWFVHVPIVCFCI